jgi:hypothetical protein
MPLPPHLGGLVPKSVHDREAAQDRAWGNAYAQVGGLSPFRFRRGMKVYMGYGPGEGEMFVSNFQHYDGRSFGYGGPFPVEKQPVIPEVDPWLRRLRR